MLGVEGWGGALQGLGKGPRPRQGSLGGRTSWCMEPGQGSTGNSHSPMGLVWEVTLHWRCCDLTGELGFLESLGVRPAATGGLARAWWGPTLGAPAVPGVGHWESPSLAWRKRGPLSAISPGGSSLSCCPQVAGRPCSWGELGWGGRAGWAGWLFPVLCCSAPADWGPGSAGLPRARSLPSLAG